MGATVALVDPPQDLYRAGALELPEALCQAYGNRLCEQGLFSQCMEKPAKPPIGGAGLNATLEHFTHSFSTSAVRGQYALLDIHDALATVPGDLLVSLSAERIALLDLAAGAGGGTLGLLCTLAVLRFNNLVPTTPVTIRILAADISPHALEIYERLVGVLSPDIRNVGIEVSVQTKVWDATKSNETALLMDQWFAANTDAEEHVALISALSGGGPGLAKAIERSVQHVSDRLANHKSTFFFLEPSMKGTGEFWRRILDALHLGWFGPESLSGLRCQYKWWHPYTGKDIEGSIWVSHYRRI